MKYKKSIFLEEDIEDKIKLQVIVKSDWALGMPSITS
jgi:hypothetical protein